MTSVPAFKEWSLICDFLETGLQTLILRKGGIAEGREGFQFRHPAFFLFPTRFHEQARHLRNDFLARMGSPHDGRDIEAVPDGAREEVAVRLYAETVETRVLHDWEAVRALSPFHGWDESTVRERFEYKDAPGISLAVLRVFRLPEAWTFPNLPRYGGCRSWLDVPACPQSLFGAREAALDDHTFTARVAELPLASASAVRPGTRS